MNGFSLSTTCSFQKMRRGLLHRVYVNGRKLFEVIDRDISSEHTGDDAT